MDKTEIVKYGWIYIFSFWLFASAIKGSVRRWLSLGYAVAAVVLIFILGTIMTFIVGPDPAGLAITIGTPIAAVFGAFQGPRRPDPPRRKK